MHHSFALNLGFLLKIDRKLIKLLSSGGKIVSNNNKILNPSEVKFGVPQ